MHLTEDNLEVGMDSIWVNIADIMSGLMMVFMFVALAFMYQLQKQQNSTDTMKNIYRNELNKALHEAFDKNLLEWKAEITEDNIFRFNSPFDVGSSDMSDEFEHIISEFYPRYISLLTHDRFKAEIAEVRIEGHTSDGWGEGDSVEDNYINNMYLSQMRASKVLDFAYRLHDYKVQKNRKWSEKYLRANGMSYSNLIYQTEARIFQDKEKSRRVEFRVITQ